MMRTQRFAGRLASAAAVAGALVVLAAAPASAHYNYIYHGDDFASINSSHSQISVCNQERDGNAVRAEVRRSGGTTTYTDTSEDGLCRTWPLVSTASSWRLCEVGVSCSTWRAV
jgi:hypothetical protein